MRMHMRMHMHMRHAHAYAHAHAHAQASHPGSVEIMHAVDRRPWSAPLRAPAHRIVRGPQQTDNVELSTLCRPLQSPLRLLAKADPPLNATAPRQAAPGRALHRRWRCTYCSVGPAAPPDATPAATPTTPSTATSVAAAAAADASSAAAATSAVPGEVARQRACPAALWDATPLRDVGAAAAGVGSRPNCSRRAAWRPPYNASAERRGFCAGTSDDTPCDLFGGRTDRGAWDTRKYRLRTLRDCAALCRTCAHCVYVSFNLASHDCSWYGHCDMDELQGKQGGYSSMRVREP